MFRYLPTIVGVKLFANAVWYRSKAKLKDALAHQGSHTPTGSRRPYWTPLEILEMIISHLTYDVRTLKACAATCFVWYNVATPHLHHTLTLRQWATDTSRTYLNPLESLHELELLPFVKQMQFERGIFGTPWVSPAIFDSESVRYFGALENLQDLVIAGLDFSKFPVGAGKYFGHFSPTLRSVALSGPRGTRRELLDFFRLFPKLDDVKILHYHAWTGAHEVFDAPLIPIRGGLRGRLTLKNFGDEGLLKDMIVAFGRMRFTSMDLHDVLGMQLLLEVCADTLETVHIHPGGALQHCKRVSDPGGVFPIPELTLFVSIPPTLQLLVQYHSSISGDPGFAHSRIAKTRSHNQRTCFHHHLSSVLRDCCRILRARCALAATRLG